MHLGQRLSVRGLQLFLRKICLCYKKWCFQAPYLSVIIQLLWQRRQSLTDPRTSSFYLWFISHKSSNFLKQGSALSKEPVWPQMWAVPNSADQTLWSVQSSPNTQKPWLSASTLWQNNTPVPLRKSSLTTYWENDATSCWSLYNLQSVLNLFLRTQDRGRRQINKVSTVHFLMIWPCECPLKATTVCWLTSELVSNNPKTIHAFGRKDNFYACRVYPTVSDNDFRPGLLFLSAAF